MTNQLTNLLGFQTMFNSAVQYIEGSDSFQNNVIPYRHKPTPFRQEFPFHKRSEEALYQLRKYPARVPIILEDDTRGNRVRAPNAKRKFLVPHDMTFGGFMYSVRKRAKLEPQQALFMFINKESPDGETLNHFLPPISAQINTLYIQHRDKDHFLYLVVCTENTFG